MILFSNSQQYQVFLLHSPCSLSLSIFHVKFAFFFHPCHRDCCVLMCLHRGVVDALRPGRAFPTRQKEESLSSLPGPVGRVWGHCPTDAPRPLWSYSGVTKS